MPLYVKGTNIEIKGTLETLSGCAIVQGLNEDGSPDYAGDTEVWWDEQRTVRRDGEAVWVDEGGGEHLQSEIEERDEEIEEGDE